MYAFQNNIFIKLARISDKKILFSFYPKPLTFEFGLGTLLYIYVTNVYI